jgi:hypothetical protein
MNVGAEIGSLVCSAGFQKEMILMAIDAQTGPLEFEKLKPVTRHCKTTFKRVMEAV